MSLVFKQHITTLLISNAENPTTCLRQMPRFTHLYDVQCTDFVTKLLEFKLPYIYGRKFESLWEKKFPGFDL